MSSEEELGKENKYIVGVKPSSSPSRRAIVLILVVAVALVTVVVLLATLIPIYVTGNRDEGGSKQLSEQQSDENYLTKSNTGSSTATSLSPTPASTTSSQATISSPLANLVPNTEAKWSRWSSWSDCSKTCGTGTRQRNRTCVAIRHNSGFTPVSCAGKPMQSKTCAEWNCPDCNRKCIKGTLNDECNACTCDDHVLTGRILSKTNVSLSEASIALVESPYRVLAQTDISGFFTAFNVCADAHQELLITKTGFVPMKKNTTVMTPTTAKIAVMLEIAVPPSVTVHPESKMRMPGQSVTFCCDGKGNPPPEIEWFKDNNIIDKDLYNYNNTLEITASNGLNGTYRCRVVNDFGSEFSNTAVLKIVEQSVDTCSPKPKSNKVTLPEGCVTSATNSSIIDLGKCKPVTCLKEDFSFNSSCRDPSFCCGARNFTHVLVKCRDVSSYNLTKVTHCSCGICIQNVTVIEGIIVGGPEKKIIKYGDVIYGGKVVAKTDEEGTFFFAISEKNVKRVVVTFKDSFNEEYEERKKVIVIREGGKIFHKIMLKQIPSPVVFNASQPLNISLRSDPNIDGFANLELPAESFLTENGSVFHGNASATISVTDPRSLSDVLTAPGDFTTIDEDGEQGLLETYGTVKLKFEDDTGQQLFVCKPMKLSLVSGCVKNGTGIPLKLYWLDSETGRWREYGDFLLESGSSEVYFAVTVTPPLVNEILNIDVPVNTICARVTTDSPMEGPLRAIRQEGSCYRGYIEQTISSEGEAFILLWQDGNFYLEDDNDECKIPINSQGLSPNVEADTCRDGGNALDYKCR
ncbi:hypothetical protein ACROYT_G031648 [Oculina patagonica]